MINRKDLRPTIRRGSMREFIGSNPALKGCWSLNGNTLDESGNGNHGTLINGATYGLGIFGNAGRFDGINAYIDCGGGISLAPSQAITIGTWFKWDGSADYDHIVTRASLSGTDGYFLQITPTDLLSFYIGASGLTTTTTMPINRWTYLTTTYDRANMIIYMDGRLDKFKAETIAIPAYFTPGLFNFIIGSFIGSYHFFAGLIDEMHLFSRALSAAEISQYYKWATAVPKKYWFYTPEIAASPFAINYYEMLNRNRRVA